MLNFILYVCKDGILRVSIEGRKEFIPLSYLQKTVDDYQFWSYWGLQEVVFEEGVTIHSFFRALSPWVDYWGMVVGKDLKSYLKEVSTLRPIKSQDDLTKIDWISIVYYTELAPELHYHRNTEEPFDVIKELNNRKPPEVLPKWEIYSGYKINGYCKNQTEHYAIEHYPLNVISGVPLYLAPEQYLIVDDYFVGQYAKKEQKLLNPNGLGVKKVGEKYRGDFSLVSGNKRHIIRDVIEGFFQLFFNTIADREETGQQIAAAIAEADIGMDSTLSETKKTETNITVADGAFDSLIEDAKKMKSYWETTIKNATEDNQIIRIGQITKGASPENKVFAFTLPND